MRVAPRHAVALLSTLCRMVHELPCVLVQIMDVVLAYGGDVMKFAGDSVIVAFYSTAGEATAPDQGLRSATMRCVRCATELSSKCGEHQFLTVHRRLQQKRRMVV